MPDTDLPRGACLVGSLPFATAEESLRVVATTLGPRLKRIPDGDTAKPPPWNSWTTAAYGRTEGLELVDPGGRTFRPTRDADGIEIARVGFADPARTSYRALAALKDEGVASRAARLQTGLPTLLMPLYVLLEAASRPLLEGAQLDRLRLEIDELCEAVPRDELAVQWDAAVDLGVYTEHHPAYFDDARAGVVERLAACVDLVPPDVEMGIGFSPGRHTGEQSDARAVAELVAAVAVAASRPVDWVHVAVPAVADPAAWVAPLRGLQTELYLELVHEDDELDAAQRRVAAVQEALPAFGLASPCVLGSLERGRAIELLELLRDLTAPVL